MRVAWQRKRSATKASRSLRPAIPRVAASATSLAVRTTPCSSSTLLGALRDVHGIASVTSSVARGRSLWIEYLHTAHGSTSHGAPIPAAAAVAVAFHDVYGLAPDPGAVVVGGQSGSAHPSPLVKLASDVCAADEVSERTRRALLKQLLLQAPSAAERALALRTAFYVASSGGLLTLLGVLDELTTLLDVHELAAIAKLLHGSLRFSAKQGPTGAGSGNQRWARLGLQLATDWALQHHSIPIADEVLLCCREAPDLPVAMQMILKLDGAKLVSPAGSQQILHSLFESMKRTSRGAAALADQRSLVHLVLRHARLCLDQGTPSRPPSTAALCCALALLQSTGAFSDTIDLHRAAQQAGCHLATPHGARLVTEAFMAEGRLNAAVDALRCMSIPWRDYAPADVVRLVTDVGRALGVRLETTLIQALVVMSMHVKVEMLVPGDALLAGLCDRLSAPGAGLVTPDGLLAFVREVARHVQTLSPDAVLQVAEILALCWFHHPRLHTTALEEVFAILESRVVLRAGLLKDFVCYVIQTRVNVGSVVSGTARAAGAELMRSLRSTATTEEDPASRSFAFPLRSWSCWACKASNSERYNSCECGAHRHVIWKCPACGSACEPHQAECHTCGLSRPAAVVETPEQCPPELILGRRAPWRCPQCKTTNPFQSATHCVRCGANAGPLSRHCRPEPCSSCGAVNERGFTFSPLCTACWKPAKAQHKAEPPHTWRCPLCNGLQPWTAVVCGACGPHVLRVAAWEEYQWRPAQACASCAAGVSSPLQEACNSCATPLKRPHLKRAEKQWICSRNTCNALNAAEEGACRLCGAAAPAKGVRQWFDAAGTAVRCNNCGADSVADPPLTPMCAACSTPGLKVDFDHVRLSETCRWLLTVSDPLTVATVLEQLVARTDTVHHATWALCAANLAAVLGKWHPMFDLTTITGRRGVALCIKLAPRVRCSLPAVDRAQCQECLGTHPEPCCAFSASLHWKCHGCGTNNDGTQPLQRYFCRSCLDPRPELASMELLEGWECPSCKRVNMPFEDLCVYCHWCKAGHMPSDGGSVLDAAAELSPLVVPLLPAKCGVCGEPHLEALCPSCSDDPVPEEIRDGRGVVCQSGTAFAFVQPEGTIRADQRVFVSKRVIDIDSLSAGQPVRFSAKAGDRGLRATSVSYCD